MKDRAVNAVIIGVQVLIVVAGIAAAFFGHALQDHDAWVESRRP